MQSETTQVESASEEPLLRKKVKYNAQEYQELSQNSNSVPAIRLKIANEKLEIKPSKQLFMTNLSNINLKKAFLDDPSKYNDTFTGVKYKNTTYRINDNLLVRNEVDPENDFICQLLRVIRPNNPEDVKLIAVLEIQWYYKKNDLPKKYAPYLLHISENEIFLSTHKDFIMVDCINGPFKLLTYDEYDNLPDIPPYTYFTRANFDVAKKQIVPPIEQWPKHCICKSPLNPDHIYIQCDKCIMWFHLDCLGMTNEEANAMDSYVCVFCKAAQ